MAQRRVDELVKKILGPACRSREQTNTQSSSSASNQSIDIPEDGPLTHRLEEGFEEGTGGPELHAVKETRLKSSEQGSSKDQGRDKEETKTGAPYNVEARPDDARRTTSKVLEPSSPPLIRIPQLGIRKNQKSPCADAVRKQIGTPHNTSRAPSEVGSQRMKSSHQEDRKRPSCPCESHRGESSNLDHMRPRV